MYMRMGAAAAEMATGCCFDIVDRGGRIAFEQRRATHHETRRAEPALHGVMRDESRLHGMQLVIVRLPTSIASIIQAAIGFPSSQTVQAEQAPRSQPTLVPVKSSESRNASANVVFGSMNSECDTLFTSSVSGTGPGPTASRSAACASEARKSGNVVSSITVLAAPIPEPLKNDRRDMECLP